MIYEEILLNTNKDFILKYLHNKSNSIFAIEKYCIVILLEVILIVRRYMTLAETTNTLLARIASCKL